MDKVESLQSANGALVNSFPSLFSSVSRKSQMKFQALTKELSG